MTTKTTATPPPATKTVRNLTERQRRFVEAYIETGNGSESARRAGYAPPHDVVGSQTLVIPKVALAIRASQQKIAARSVLTGQQLREFWTNTILGKQKDADFKDRLKASELLARASGEFASVAIVTPPGASSGGVIVGQPEGDGGPVITVYMPSNGR